MKQQELFPAEFSADFAESYLYRISVRSQLIYTTVVAAVLLALLSLPFVYVDVSVQSNGIIRPVAERHEIKSLVAGTVEAVLVRENQYVVQGQSLLRIKTEMLDYKLRFNEEEQARHRHLIADLEKLLTYAQALRPLSLSSSLYIQQYSRFKSQLRENSVLQQKLQSELLRDQQLYAQKAIARQEMEQKQYELNKAQAEYASAMEQQLSHWQEELAAYRRTLGELQAHQSQLRAEKQLYLIQSPVCGNIQQWAGKYAGSYVQAGEALGLVSPDSTLIAECMVGPSDIGYLQAGMPVRLQIDAFNYNEWGLLEGKIKEVDRDFTLLEGKPVFKIRCQLASSQLRLQNGYKGQLKKGMTLKARFFLARRSLWQLLYDRVDNWMNPYL